MSDVLFAAVDSSATTNDLKKVEQEIKAAKLKLNKTQSEKNKIQSTLKSTEVALSEVEKGVNQLRKNLAKQKIELIQFQHQEKILDQSKKEQEKAIAEHIKTSYILGKEKKIKTILNQQDPQKISRSMVYADYFNKARVNELQQFETTLVKIAENKLAIGKRKSDLLANKENLDKKQKELQLTYQARNDALGKLKQESNTHLQKLNQLQANQAQLEKLLRSVQKSAKNVSTNTQYMGSGIAFEKTKGNLHWPTQGRMDNRFGKARQPGDLIWEGVTFYADKGTDIRAVHSGNIAFSEWFPGKGLLTIIDHGNGYMTLYAHSQTLLHVAGDKVNAGEKIATMGESGGLDVPQLYFEIRFQGAPVNPIAWFSKTN